MAGVAKSAPKSPEFKIGDKAVYPAHGVGIIDRIEHKEIAGNIVSFYVMRILDSDITVMVPTNNDKLRRLIQKEKVRQVYKVFEKQDVVIDTTTWNRRQREYLEKIKTGSLFEIAEVMRDLYVLRGSKTLSFGERKMLDTARTLLVKELAIAKSVDETVIEQEIGQMFQA